MGRGQCFRHETIAVGCQFASSRTLKDITRRWQTNRSSRERGSNQAMKQIFSQKSIGAAEDAIS